MFTGKWTGGAVAGVSFSLIFSIKMFHWSCDVVKHSFNVGFECIHHDKDTLLIIPIPKKNKNYATLKDVCDNSSITQKKYFWKKVSKLVKKFMKNEKYVWISTHGLGVSYMHIRISNKPKYYFDNELKKI